MTTPSKVDRAALLKQAIRVKRAKARSATPRLPPRPEGVDARLSELQRSLWLLHRLEPDSPAYNLASAFRVSGKLDVMRLERALNGVVSRHRLLRSTFRADRDSALQIVHPESTLRVEKIEAGEGELLTTAVREASRPFELEKGLSVRLLLVEEASEAEGLLVLILHHILADERSLGFVWRELAAGYAGSPPAGEVFQYDDYVHWQAGQDPQPQVDDLAFWRRRLDPPPADLSLPFERADGAGDGAGPRGALLSRFLGDGVREGIRRLAVAAGTTPFSVHALAFRLLLHRYCEGRDVAFATPASRRSHPATAEMVGYFLNPVVIHAAIDEGHSVEQAVRDFAAEMRESLGHASVPFDVLVEELSPPRQPGRHPIFQTMFVYQEAPPPPELEGVRLEPLTLDLGESKFDLTLFVSDVATSAGERGLEIAAEYRRSRFDEVWIRGLLDHFQTLIENLGIDPGRALAEVPMLPSAAKTELCAAAQGPPLEGGESPESSTLLPRQILDQARRLPREPAVLSSENDWKWAKLEQSATRIAAELAARDVGPGDRVALLLDRSPLMIAGLLGCHWAGAAYVPLDPAYPAARNRDVLEDAEVSAVVTRQALLDRLPSGLPVVPADALAEGDRPWDLPEIAPEHPAYLLYTSGSTGRPKGVIIRHGNLRASNDARLLFYRELPTPRVRFLLLPSVAFDSSVAGIFWALATGGALVIPTGEQARDPRQLARLIVEKRVTTLLCVPSLYAHILAHLAGAGDGDSPESLEAVIVAGESCPRPLVAEHFQRLPAVRLFNEYGPTEATVWASVHELTLGDVEDSGPVPIGRPIPGVRLEVLDERGRRVPAGIPGQGWIAGPTLAAGYWRRDDLTGERFVERQIDGEDATVFYRTGDRLSWTPDGRLKFLGRVDEQIKLRGFRIEPGEIETLLLEVSGVDDVGVVARSDRLTAFVETSDPIPENVAAEWRQQLARKLPEHMVPSRIVALEKFPHLPNGKVDRAGLREMPLPEEGSETPPSSADTGVLDERQQALISLWEGLLGRTGISISDNFFQLGGHSLLAVEMASAIERDFGVELTPADVFQHPTVADLKERIERRRDPTAPDYAHLFPIQPGGRQTPFLFCIPHFFTRMVATRFRGERPVYGLRGVGLRPEGNYGRWPTMRHLGEELVEEIDRRFPEQSVIMAGYSFGATMAVEAVRLMEERGHTVERLILIAPMPLDFWRVGPLAFQLDALRRPIDELSFSRALQHVARDNHPFSRRPYQRLWRRLAIEPWRRLLCRAGQRRRRAGLPLTDRMLWADVRVERFRLHSRYRPGIVQTPTVIFNAREPETDAAATWRPYFGGPLTVIPTPDPHLDEASIAAAKKLILEYLDDSDA